MSEKQELTDAVDAFSDAMKSRLHSKLKQCWSGWDAMGKESLGERLLLNAARGAVNGDKKSLVDVANLAMMIHRQAK